MSSSSSLMTIWPLSKKKGDKVHQEFAAEINKLYPGDTYRPKNFLQEVEDYMGYKQRESE